MPPKHVNLAHAGIKLQGPPEGYDKKKEREIKRWLLNNPPPLPQDSDVAASVSSVSEVGGTLDPELEELFDDLRDSGDLDLVTGKLHEKEKKTKDESVPRPPKQIPKPVEPPDHLLASQPKARPRTSSGAQPPRVSSQYAALGPRPATSTAPQTSAPTGTDGRAPLPPPGSKSLELDTSKPPPALRASADNLRKPAPEQAPHAAPPSPGPSAVPPSTSEYPDSSSGSGTPSLSQSPGPKPGPLGAPPSPPGSSPREKALGPPAPPLDFVLDGFGLDSALGVLGGNADTEDARQATAVAAGMLIARAEAAGAAHATGGPPSEVDKFKAALLMAVRERQRLSEEVQGELATARASNAAAQQDALQKVAGAAADAAAAAQRAAVAEAETGRLRAELARLQQDGKVRRMDLEDREEDHKIEISRLQAEVAAAVSRLEAQGESREKSLRAAHEDSIAAREAAVALDRQYKQLRRQYDLDKTRLEGEVASLRGELRARDTDMQRLTQEKQKALEGWQAEAAARILAEESEKRALKAAKKQAETLESLTHARSANAAIKQQAALAAQRNAALKASDPAAAAIHAPAATPTKDAKKGGAFVLEEAGGSPNRADPGGAEEGKLFSPRRRPRTPSTPKGTAKALQCGSVELELSRAEHHRVLSRGLAADKTHLGEVLRNQKRALLAAQLAENRAVEEALAAAPEQLRILGLAFRALLVAEPAQLTPDAPGAQLAMGLGAAGYRTFVDPLMVTPHPPPIPPMPGMDVPPSAPMVGISGAVVLLATPGLLSTHPSPPTQASANPANNSSNQHPGSAANGGSAATANQPGDASEGGGGGAAAPEPCPLPVAAVMEAAVRGVPLVIVASQGLTLEALMGGRHTPDAVHARISGTAEATQGPAFSEKALAWIHAAWSSRIISDAPQAPSSTSSKQQSAGQHAISETVSQRLGVPDVELKGISLDTLKRMSIHKTLCVPDLRHLNCTRVSHLKVLLAPQARMPAVQEEGPPLQPLMGMQVQTLLNVLRGNTTLTTLTLKGCDIHAAEAVAQVVAGTDPQQQQQQQQQNGGASASAPECWQGSNICSITVGMEVPVGGLLAKPGVPPLLDMDLSQAGELFTPEDAAVLQVTLAAAVASSQGCALRSLALPVNLSRAFDDSEAQAVLTRLASTITELPQLEKLNGSRAANAAALASAVSSSGVLDLSGCFLGPVAAEALLGAKGSPSGLWGPSLRALNLTGCQIGPQGAAQVAAAVQGEGTSLESLQTVCLADNRLGPAGAATLCAALTRQQQGSSSAPLVGRGSKLKALDMTLNLLGDEGAKTVCKVLKDASPPLSCLASLALGGNAIGVDGARALAQVLPSLTSLLELHLPGNYLGDMGVCALSKAAASLPHLRSLQLQENYNIGTEGARTLGNLLSSSTSLKELQLAKNHVGVEGARQLALGLAANSTLVSLNLEWCKMRGEGVAHMASALGGHKSLLLLNLARNGMGDRGVKAVAGALEGNTVLRRIDLRVNSIGLVGCRLVGTLLRDKNTTLMQVFMGGNEMEEHVLEALEDLAATPRTLPQRKRLAVPSAPPPGHPTPSTQPASMAAALHIPALPFDGPAAAANSGAGAIGSGGLGLMSSRRSNSARSSGSAVAGGGSGALGADGRKGVVSGLGVGSLGAGTLVGEGVALPQQPRRSQEMGVGSAHFSRPSSAAAAAAQAGVVSLNGKHHLQPRPLSGASNGSRHALHDSQPRPLSGASSSSRRALHDSLQQPSLPMQLPPSHQDEEQHSLGQRQQVWTPSPQQQPQVQLGDGEAAGLRNFSESEDLEALLARYRS